MRQGLSEQLHADEDYNLLLQSISVHRGIHGLKGGQVRTILRNINKYCQPLEYHINFEEFKYAMELFAWLDRNTHRTMHEEHIMWRDTAHEFHRIIMMNWPAAGRAWSTETMERFNMWMKYAKNYRSVPDQKEAKKKTMEPQYVSSRGTTIDTNYEMDIKQIKQLGRGFTSTYQITIMQQMSSKGA
jgi:hypothetical protein